MGYIDGVNLEISPNNKEYYVTTNPFLFVAFFSFPPKTRRPAPLASHPPFQLPISPTRNTYAIPFPPSQPPSCPGANPIILALPFAPTTTILPAASCTCTIRLNISANFLSWVFCFCQSRDVSAERPIETLLITREVIVRPRK
jgi:hypothetical protein